MRLFLFIFTIFLFFTFQFSYWFEEEKKIQIQWREFSYDVFSQRLGIIIERKKFEDLYEKRQYILMLKKALFLLKSEDINDIINNFLAQINKKIHTDENTVKEVIIWKSILWKEIKAIYKWDVNQWFLLFVWSIHGAYEYGTYESIKVLAKKLQESNKKQWMIIETLNPDGLEIFKKNWDTNESYLEGRWNFNQVDLNRNFCTLNYQSGEYIKYSSNDNEETMTFSLWDRCGSEPEVQAIDYLLKNFKINRAIDLHSKWGIIFIPDNSIDDSRIKILWEKVKQLLWGDYVFDINYKSESEKKRKIQIYEADEGGAWIYTWMLITYLYEKFNIPSVIIELEKHWVVEENIVNLVDLLE